jgi:hypothetical protein
MNRLLTAALTYAAHGWAVLPLHTPLDQGCSCGQDCGGSAGKHPRTLHGLHDASRQPDQLWHWWRRWPEANVGIRTGKTSGLVILDVDTRHSGEDSLAALEAAYDSLPSTLTAQSGGGGQHLYFRHPGPRLPNSTQVGGYAGLDVRGDGGYIVAPPSRHRSGTPYRWASPSAPLALLPDWFGDLLLPKPPASRTAHPLVPPLPPQDCPQFWVRLALERARPGNRNATELLS